MQLDLDRTIVAISSPLSPARRAIVRLSGVRTRELLQKVLAECDSPKVPHQDMNQQHCQPAALEQLWQAQHPSYIQASADLDWHGRRLDVGVYYWPTQRSFTGQPVAELHLLGSLPLAQRLMNCFVSLGASPAERGEFALRSFLAGKMDLVQAEAVLGVIQSVDRDQLQWSLSQLGGNLSQPVHVLRAELLELISRLEAGLDFVEEDIQFITPQEIHERLTRVLEQIEQLRSRLQSRGTPQRQLEVALVGLPNAGKSSLFNALLERERAIVSNQAGTTRDVISAPLGLDDITLTLVDTAGLEPDLPASQPAEASPRLLAQSHTRQRLQTCDIALLCVDSSHPPTTAWIIQQRQQLEADQLRVLTVGTKADLLGGRQPHLPVDIAVSAYAPESIQALRECLQSLASAGSQHQFTQATLHTAIRCTEALQHARQSLQHAQWLNQSVAGDELVASELRVALDDLAAMIGQVHSDDILGEVFSRFCIGK